MCAGGGKKNMLVAFSEVSGFIFSKSNIVLFKLVHILNTDRHSTGF